MNKKLFVSLQCLQTGILLNYFLVYFNGIIYKFEAGDMNGDGSLTTSDVAALIGYVLANGGTLDFDPTNDI